VVRVRFGSPWMGDHDAESDSALEHRHDLQGPCRQSAAREPFPTSAARQSHPAPARASVHPANGRRTRNVPRLVAWMRGRRLRRPPTRPGPKEVFRALSACGQPTMRRGRLTTALAWSRGPRMEPSKLDQGKRSLFLALLTWAGMPPTRRARAGGAARGLPPPYARRLAWGRHGEGHSGSERPDTACD
jgi:hypothetical protein